MFDSLFNLPLVVVGIAILILLCVFALSGLAILAAISPTLELRDVNGALLASNDDWKNTQQSEIAAMGLAPPNILESAIVGTLMPGNYTAIVRGFNNTIGNALVEVYGLN